MSVYYINKDISVIDSSIRRLITTKDGKRTLCYGASGDGFPVFFVEEVNATAVAPSGGPSKFPEFMALMADGETMTLHDVKTGFRCEVVKPLCLKAQEGAVQLRNAIATINDTCENKVGLAAWTEAVEEALKCLTTPKVRIYIGESKQRTAVIDFNTYEIGFEACSTSKKWRVFGSDTWVRWIQCKLIGGWQDLSDGEVVNKLNELVATKCPDFFDDDMSPDATV